MPQAAGRQALSPEKTEAQAGTGVFARHWQGLVSGHLKSLLSMHVCIKYLIL